MTCACGCSKGLGRCKGSGASIEVRIARVVRCPTLPVGELRGVIYRARRRLGEPVRTYVHFFQDRLPILSTNPHGTRLFIVGGKYRVTRNGIQG
jgi:hypothetical protein